MRFLNAAQITTQFTCLTHKLHSVTREGKQIEELKRLLQDKTVIKYSKPLFTVVIVHVN